ncbi:MAG: restriction endonuclease subunit S [Algibacter sp.]
MNKRKTIGDIISSKGVFNDGDWVESKDQDPNGDIRLIQLADIGDGVFINKSNRFMNKETAIRLNCTFLKRGDILMARMPDPIGRACIFPGIEFDAVTVVDVCVIRPLNTEVYNDYLKFLINNDIYRREINKHVTGTTRKRISRKNLNKIKFDLPSLENQKRIAQVLANCENLIQKRKESIALLDELLKSTFLEMFGNPVRNEKKWDYKTIKEHIGKVSTGNTPLRKDVDNFGEFIEWIKTDNIKRNNKFLSTSREYLSKKGKQLGRVVQSNSLLVSCIAGSIKSIGNIAIANREVAFNQQINAIAPYNDVDIEFLYWMFFISKEYLESKANKGMKKMISKSDFEKIKFPKPDFDLQLKFSAVSKKVETIKQSYQIYLQELENLYGSLSQKAFKGELDLSNVVLKKIVAIKIDNSYFTTNKEQTLKTKTEQVNIGFIKPTSKDVENILKTTIKDGFKTTLFSIEDIEKELLKNKISIDNNEIKKHLRNAMAHNIIKQEYSGTTKQVMFKLKK